MAIFNPYDFETVESFKQTPVIYVLIDAETGKFLGKDQKTSRYSWTESIDKACPFIDEDTLFEEYDLICEDSGLRKQLFPDIQKTIDRLLVEQGPVSEAEEVDEDGLLDDWEVLEELEARFQMLPVYIEKFKDVNKDKAMPVSDYADAGRKAFSLSEAKQSSSGRLYESEELDLRLLTDAESSLQRAIISIKALKKKLDGISGPKKYFVGGRAFDSAAEAMSYQKTL